MLTHRTALPPSLGSRRHTYFVWSQEPCREQPERNAQFLINAHRRLPKHGPQLGDAGFSAFGRGGSAIGSCDFVSDNGTRS